MPLHNFDEIIDRRNSGSIKWNKYPADVLPMWVADADFRIPAPVSDILEKQVKHGVFGYSSQSGLLNEAAAYWMSSRFGWHAKPEWVAFSPSVVMALTFCVLAFTEPGDNILFVSPYYPPFSRIPKSHGRVPLASPMLRRGDTFAIDYADLENKMADPKSKLMFLCNPHNPTGKVHSREELLRLGEICVKHDILIVSDEIHSDYVFSGKIHIPFPSLSEEMAERTLVAINPSKTFNIADLHTSAVICSNRNLLDRFSKLTETMCIRPGSLGITALHAAYMECGWYAGQVAAYVKANMDLAVPYINERIPGIRAYVPESTYMLWLDCRELGFSQEELEQFFLRKAKVALNNGTDFGQEGKGFMRMNLACPRVTMLEGLSRIDRAVGNR